MPGQGRQQIRRARPVRSPRLQVRRGRHRRTRRRQVFLPERFKWVPCPANLRPSPVNLCLGNRVRLANQGRSQDSPV